ncbi:MAG: alpha/beta hydrolase [Luteibacter sp.]
MSRTLRLLHACVLALAVLTGVAHGGAAKADTALCYDPGDPADIRLWEGRAPGATGDDPCRDIPFLRIYVPAAGGTAARTAIVVMPGGGYDRLTDAKEQAPVGEHFSRQWGITTFVLVYRRVQPDGTYRYPVPMWDAQRAMRLVRSRAAQYHVEANRIGAFGFSAGGHLAATISTHADTDFGLARRDAIDRERARPDFLGLGYPVISMLPDAYASPASLHHLLHGYEGSERAHLEHNLSAQENVTGDMPPVFLFESMDDARISPQNSVLFAEALRSAGVPSDVHLFPHGVHGSGLAVGIPGEEAWPGMFRDWLKGRHYLD